LLRAATDDHVPDAPEHGAIGRFEETKRHVHDETVQGLVFRQLERAKSPAVLPDPLPTVLREIILTL
jgi:hypothetical protein